MQHKGQRRPLQQNDFVNALGDVFIAAQLPARISAQVRSHHRRSDRDDDCVRRTERFYYRLSGFALHSPHERSSMVEPVQSDRQVRSRNHVNVVVAGKLPAPQRLTMDQAIGLYGDEMPAARRDNVQARAMTT